MGLAQRDQNLHTYGEYLTWPEDGEFGKPEVAELNQPTPVGILKDVAIEWEGLLERIPKRDYY